MRTKDSQDAARGQDRTDKVLLNVRLVYAQSAKGKSFLNK